MQGLAATSSSLGAPEVGEGEVLTGAELYHYLLEENTDQLHKAETKIAEYTSLKTTLGSLTDRCRRPLLAPVANGLGYFEAELESTNNILVLLGDGWFAERSASQAAAIAQRRLDFLRREQQVLVEEKKNLMDRRELFLSEVPEAAEALDRVADGKLPATTGTASASASGKELRQASSDGATSEDDLANLNDAAITTFDEQDELTEDELIALEAELADHIDDDEYVERVMLERMIAKKEARVRAELAARPAQTESKPVTTPSVPSTDAKEKPLKGGSTGPTKGDEVKYQTPADIIAAYAAHASNMRVCIPADPDTITEASPTTITTGATAVPQDVASVTSTEPKKSVSFADTVEVRYDDRQTSASEPMAPPAPSTPPTQNARVTYAVGDIVEHAGSGGGEGATGERRVPALNPVFSASGSVAAAPRKRKSLFQRELEGE